MLYPRGAAPAARPRRPVRRAAPAVSSVRWNPNASAMCFGTADREIERVTGRGTESLRGAVRVEERRGRQPGTPDGEQPDASHRGDGVSGAGDLLVSTVSVGERGTAERGKDRECLVGAIERPKFESGETELEGQEERDHRVDHLRGDVGEEAREAQTDDVAADHRSPAGAGSRWRLGSRCSKPSERRIQPCFPFRSISSPRPRR